MTAHKHHDEDCDSDDLDCPLNKARTEAQLRAQSVCADPQCGHPAFMHITGRCSFMPTPGYHCRCAAFRDPAKTVTLDSAQLLGAVERRSGEDRREAVNHPDHYGGGDNPFEAIKVIDAWNLDFCLGNTVKYISRAGKKDPAKLVEDLAKAEWYLSWKIDSLVLTEQLCTAGAAPHDRCNKFAHRLVDGQPRCEAHMPKITRLR